MSVNSKMTAIADEIRELSGTTGTMGLDAMASTLNAENTNFASNLTTQDNLISQIQTALQNKAAATGEDVTSETNAYTNKLATLETAINALEIELQGKASGGTSVETCTVTISFQHGDPVNVWISATQLINGNIQPFSFVDYSSNAPESFTSPYTISNIVKNTPITISGYGSYSISSSPVTSNGCELLYSSVAAKTLAVNITESEATIIIQNDY